MIKMRQSILFIIVATSVVMMFQNCGQVQFDSTLKGTDPLSSVEGGTGAPDEQPGQPSSPVSLPVDIEIGSQIDFGKVQINNSLAKKLSVRNKSSKSLMVAATSASVGSFSADLTDCKVLPAGQSCEITVSFQPAEAKQENVQLALSAQQSNSGQIEGTKKVVLTGEGFFIPPSADDVLSMVGWYVYRPDAATGKVAIDNTKPGFEACPASARRDDYNSAELDSHGDSGHYCYDPSGAHGMYFGDKNGEFNKLTKYVLQSGSTFSSVPTLADLFGTPADRVSDNVCFSEALFYYALSYLVVPASVDVTRPDWDVKFSLLDVDDGLQLVANGLIPGRVKLREVKGKNSGKSFSLHRGEKNDMMALKNGVNTIVALWIDDCRTRREIKNDEILFKGNRLPLLIPNIVRGYLYSKINGIPLARATVKIDDGKGNVYSVDSDSSGFFQLTNLPDGDFVMNVSVGATVKLANQAVKLDHTDRKKSILDVSQGL